MNLSAWTAADITAAIASKEFSAREVADSALARIEALEVDVHALNQVTPDLAYAAAERVDALVAAGETLPAFAGVPAAFKDNMNLVGTRTTCSSRILANYESAYDCTAVARMVAAGVLPLGKCNMDEFAFGSSGETSATGPAKNPWDLGRIPGGSSAGSAAAVAAGMATITLGSDTGGSIRQPGAMTGTVALKPTYGRVSRYGCVAFASSLDQIGPFSRTVEDSANALAVICGKDPMDATSVERPAEDFVAATRDPDVSGMRIAIVRDMLDMEGVTPAVRQSVLDAAARFEAMGATVGEVDLPTSQHGLSAYYIIGPAEASSNLARFDGIRYGHRVDSPTDTLDLYMRSRAEGFGTEAKRRIMLGTYALSAGYYDAYYGQAQKARTLIASEFSAAFADYDVLLTPTSPQVAWKFGEKSDPLTMYLADIYTIPVNLTGNCAINVPCGFAEEDGVKLPIGLQLIGDHFAEAKVFRAAAAIERNLALDLRSPLVTGA
ncbi:MAG: Asp-tRNA(Asn)/Glu-tRNA(Gln) amidotransferase subunit GatA [Coriobacteriia bacterium]|nr:Asp-tRNA(Asn)/Glu-tRNA(Gln) amidotransferase subunit GatA [Coriobacteriia bacterium]